MQIEQPGRPNETPIMGRAAHKWAALFGATSLALGVALFMTLRALDAQAQPQPQAPPTSEQIALLDESVRRAAIAELVQSGSGVWDSHVDADVSRVLQPQLEGRELLGQPVHSNRLGMREREYGAKQPGTTRIVLLGDSFVFGHGTAASERVGSFLEPWLNERAQSPVEVLHIGISSWDIIAECAYLRRQLSMLEPDLVVQLVFNNDLDDVKGVRGFGERGRFAPRHRQRANGLVSRDAPRLATGINTANLLLYGLDGESRERYRQASASLNELSSAVQAVGGRYLCLFMWLYFQPMVEPHLAAGLPAAEIGFVSEAFLKDRSLWASADNNHWNAQGSQRVAKLIYGLAQQRGLLPQLSLPAWESANQQVDIIDGAARAELADMQSMQKRLAQHRVSNSIEWSQLDARSAAQINGGFDREGFAAPYASITLANPGASRLMITGQRLNRPELNPGSVQVWIDEIPVAQFELRGPLELDLSIQVPADLREREYLAVRFEASDYVYNGDLLDECISFQLQGLSLQ